MEQGWYSPVLSALGEDELERIFERSVARKLATGEVLHLAGDPADRIHLLERGLVKLTARDGEGRDTILGLAVPGDLLGDVAALDGYGQPLDAVAARPSKLVSLDAEVFLRVLGRSAKASLELAATLAVRTRWMFDTALERSSTEVPGRMAGRLLWLAELLGQMRGTTIVLELPLRQGDLGRLAGMSRESACKTLRTFRSQGILDYQGQKLRILRPDALDRIRCAGRVKSLTTPADARVAGVPRADQRGKWGRTEAEREEFLRKTSGNAKGPTSGADTSSGY